jgi:hypothetical protein
MRIVRIRPFTFNINFGVEVGNSEKCTDFAVMDSHYKSPDWEGAVRSVFSRRKLLVFSISTTYLGVSFQFVFDVDISFVSLFFV